MKTRAFGLTDVGRCREPNEDNYLCEPSLGLYAVADGMGGHAAGEIASQLAVDALVEAIAGDDPERPDDSPAPTERVREAVTDANRRICESIEETSITKPPAFSENPSKLWPPLLTAIDRSLSLANAIASPTPRSLRHTAIRRGFVLIRALNGVANVQKSGSSGARNTTSSLTGESAARMVDG